MTAVEWYIKKIKEARQMCDDASMGMDIWHTLDVLIGKGDQAKAMEKEQIKDAFVQCWKANIPDGVECKLDAEQYYNETFKSE